MAEFLSGGGPPWLGEKQEDDPSQQEYLPKPSFDNASTLVAWQAEQIDMPSWWPELIEVPDCKGICQFVRRIWVSFQMPMSCYHATKGENNYTAQPTPHCLNQEAYLPLSDMKFSRQDYRIHQPQKTLVYGMVLQFWAENAQPTLPGQPHQLVECIRELKKSMELLMSFTYKEVLTNDAPSHQVKPHGNEAIVGAEGPASGVLYQ